MTHLKWPLLLTVILLFPLIPVRSQTSRIAVVDFEKAVVESAEGKKSSEKFSAALQSKQADAEKRAAPPAVRPATPAPVPPPRTVAPAPGVPRPTPPAPGPGRP